MANTVRVFLDSNVILSGLISSQGSPRIILDVLSLQIPHLISLTGQYNLLEIERNIAKKAPDIMPIYQQYLPLLNLEIVPLPSAKEISRYSGSIAEKDVPVLVSAVRGKASFLVTGDKKDFNKLKKKNTHSFTIVSPSEFLDILIKEILNED